MTGMDVWFEGIPFPSLHYSPEILREVQERTNWLVETVCLIYSKGDPKWVQSEPIWDRSPWVENKYGYELLKEKEGPRLISSHLPIQLFPKSFFKSKAKRCFSVWLFSWRSAKLVKRPQSLEQYFDWFIQGNVVFGSWFDHTRDWMSMRDKNFLILSYEEMKWDTRSTVEKICQFLSKKLEPEELDSVLRNSVTGDWKNYFTVAQAETFDKLFQEKMADLPQDLFPMK
ncbi:hypothetical protein FD755_003433 [Muntiacus reevesi]|uniref:Sulfotransferase n=1 Tax=Muntiacus reevesi TaxID=9886 RepID=A0A5J5MQ79_MUNRE|nr:hypothetical protein FD755_003433 [Muntiacus reevesi]